MSNNDGWGFPTNSCRAHYFVRGRSLCGRWIYFGKPVLNQGPASDDDCKACSRKLAARAQATAELREDASELREEEA